MIAILWTARNGPNPVPQDARTRSRCSAEGADVMVGQSRGAAYRSERFQIRGLESAVRLERRDEEGHEGVLLDRYSPEGERCPAAPEMRLSTSWLLRRIRASVSLPQSSIFGLIRLVRN